MACQVGCKMTPEFWRCASLICFHVCSCSTSCSWLWLSKRKRDTQRKIRKEANPTKWVKRHVLRDHSLFSFRESSVYYTHCCPNGIWCVDISVVLLTYSISSLFQICDKFSTATITENVDRLDLCLACLKVPSMCQIKSPLKPLFRSSMPLRNRVRYAACS